VDIVGVQLRCTGTQMDPKDVTVYRGGAGITLPSKPSGRDADDDKLELPDGPWVIVKRSRIEAGPGFRDKQVQSIRFGASRGRYFKVIIHETWGEKRRVRLLAPLVVLVRPDALYARDAELSQQAADRASANMASYSALASSSSAKGGYWTPLNSFSANSQVVPQASNLNWPVVPTRPQCVQQWNVPSVFRNIWIL